MNFALMSLIAFTLSICIQDAVSQNHVPDEQFHNESSINVGRSLIESMLKAAEINVDKEDKSDDIIKIAIEYRDELYSVLIRLDETFITIERRICDWTLVDNAILSDPMFMLDITSFDGIYNNGGWHFAEENITEGALFISSYVEYEKLDSKKLKALCAAHIEHSEIVKRLFESAIKNRKDDEYTEDKVMTELKEMIEYWTKFYREKVSTSFE